MYRVALILIFAASVQAGIIQSSNRITWTGVAGVQGGIPYRTNIYTVLDTNSTAAQITTAIANCPSNSVVLLTNGTFTLSGTIGWGNGNYGVTLRGAGMGRTIIKSSADPCIDTDYYSGIDATGTTISSGGTVGSTRIVVSSAATLAVGQLMQMDSLDQTNFVMSIVGPSVRHLRFTAMVTNISGTTIDFWPPLPYTLHTSPKAYGNQLNPGAMMCGVEDMTIAPSSPPNSIVNWWTSYNCWVARCELTNGGNAFLWAIDSLQMEFRGNNIHHVNAFPNNADGFGIYIYQNSSYCLVEDNAFWNVFHAVIVSGSAGNVFAFNYATNCNSGNSTRQQAAFNANHGAHDMMTLWEGNVGNQWQNDGYHGSASHQILLRNWFHGMESGRAANIKCVDMTRGSYRHQLVGNILGSPAITNLAGFALTMTGEPDYTDMPVIYREGYPAMGNNTLQEADLVPDLTWTKSGMTSYPDTVVAATALKHGNYDYKTKDQVWDGGTADHDIPASYFYASKPSYFGILSWPAFDPASPSSASVTNIPAGYRYIYGTNPPATAGQQVAAGTVNRGTAGTLRVGR